MLKFKKNWIFLLGIILPICANYLYNPCLALWSREPDRNISNPDIEDSTTTIDYKKTEDIGDWSHWMSTKSKWILQLPKPENYDTWLWYVTALIQIVINRVLWILASVALIYMIYCGFSILLAWSNDADVSKGKKWIRTAAIALAWIGLSRLIVSAMIRFINYITDKWTHL